MTHDFAVLCTIAESVLVHPAIAEDRAIRLKELIKKCRYLNDHRVRIVHGLWFVGPKEGRLFRAPKGKIETRSQTLLIRRTACAMNCRTFCTRCSSTLREVRAPDPADTEL
jgi:hypothetical protein